PNTKTERDIWQAGTLHILGQSTRTPKPAKHARARPDNKASCDKLWRYPRPGLGQPRAGNRGLGLQDIAELKNPFGGSNQGNFAVRQTGEHCHDPPRTTLRFFTTGVVEFDLPKPLQIIDTEERDILSAIGTSNTLCMSSMAWRAAGSR
ncbi:MAG: hypothetical protein ACKPKO_28225, partial [Candidatus Fonsibacter sp.]